MEAKMIPSNSIAAPGQHSGRFAKSIEASSTYVGRKKSGLTDCCKAESGSISKHLPNRPVGCSSTCPPKPWRRRKSEGRFARRAKAGWTPERRARQAALIRNWAPWRRSTGPKTEAGKARCSKNALKHGGRSRARILELQRIRRILRKVGENIRAVRLFIRLRDARPRIKYKPHYAQLSNRFSWREPGTRAMLRATRSGGETCGLGQL